MKTRDRNNIDDIKGYYERYRSVQKQLEPGFDLSNRDLNFLKAYATSYRKFIEADRMEFKKETFYASEFSKVRENYRAAISIDSTDYGTNYNLSINLYNEAAYIIELLDENSTLGELAETQRKCVNLFKEALPYALTAFKIKPERVEINKALRAVYYSLLLDKKRDLFDEKLKSIRKGKGLDGPAFSKWQMEFDKSANEVHRKCVKSLKKRY